MEAMADSVAGFSDDGKGVQSEEMMLKVINACFAMRRKTLLNNLCASFSVSREVAGQWLEAAGLNDKIRGEALTLEQIAALSDVIGAAK